VFRSLSRRRQSVTYMQDGAALLHPLVVPSAQNAAVCGHQTCSDGDSTLGGAFPGLFEGDLETGVAGGHDEAGVGCWLGVLGLEGTGGRNVGSRGSGRLRKSDDMPSLGARDILTSTMLLPTIGKFKLT
jgi:hypothetical protein